MAWSQARINAALDAAANVGTHTQLHTGDPGASGSANVAAGVSRAAITWSAAASASKTGTAIWTIPAPGGPYTYMSIWTASSGGTWCGNGTLSPAETFAGSGTLSVTITATGS